MLSSSKVYRLGKLVVLYTEASRLIFQSNNGTPFTKEEAIDLMVSLSATDANSEKKWRGFYNSLSQSELQVEWDEYWKS